MAGERDFQPGDHWLTHDIIHFTDSDVYKLFHRSFIVESGLSEFIDLLTVVVELNHSRRAINDTAYVAARTHILDSWVLGNLSYQTAKTTKRHRQQIGHIRHTLFPLYLEAANDHAKFLVAQERYHRQQADRKVLSDADKYTDRLRGDVRDWIRAEDHDIRQLLQLDMASLREFATKLFKQAEGDILAAESKAENYADHVGQRDRAYTDKAEADAEAYAKQAAQSAERSAVNQANAFTTTAIAALVAGIIAALTAEQAELAAAEAVDAAWITGEGALLAKELGAFGKALNTLLGAAVMGTLLAYLVQGVADPITWADETHAVLGATLDPLFEALVSAIEAVT